MPEAMSDFEQVWKGSNPRSLRLSREERDYIAGHALDLIRKQSEELIYFIEPEAKGDYSDNASACARDLAALSNLLGDIGWEREARPSVLAWDLGELFPVAQPRPWLKEWQRQDNEALVERVLETFQQEGQEIRATLRKDEIAAAQTKLGTGAILLARTEKWMASHAN